MDPLLTNPALLRYCQYKCKAIPIPNPNPLPNRNPNVTVSLTLNQATVSLMHVQRSI